MGNQGSKKVLPYLICAYNGLEYFNSYLPKVDNGTNFTAKGINKIFSDFIKILIIWAKNSSEINVFAHNFSGFDGVFLLKYLLPYGEIKPIFHNGRLMSVNLHIYKVKTILSEDGVPSEVQIVIEFPDGTKHFVKKNLTIKFKDSLLFLPAPLRNLARTFRVSSGKGFFPFKLLDIFYNSVIPSIEYWSGTPILEYNIIKSCFENKY